MTVEEVKKYAMKNYENGGDAIVECWEDSDIEDFLRRNPNPMEMLNTMFAIRNEEFEAARYFSGYDEELEMEREEDVEKEPLDDYEMPDDDDYEYCPSATNGDYSPSCPWNAPGMSIRDFI